MTKKSRREELQTVLMPTQNGSTPGRSEFAPAVRSTSSTDFTKLIAPAYLGPRIRRYLGDSWSMHLPFAYDLMRELAPKMFVELGVKQGESYFSFCQSAAENEINVRCYGVDSWRGDVQTGELDPEIQREVADYNWQYSSFSELKTMLFAEALGDFSDATIDLLHIDGTHTYIEVKTDFESWLPKVAPNGIILFHDVMIRDRGFGVWKLWEEIARKDCSFLFKFGYGLGVWKKEPIATGDSAFIRRLLSADKIERREINEYYAMAASALALWQGSKTLSIVEDQTARLKGEAEERSRQVVHFQREIDEKEVHIVRLQRELEEASQHIAQLRDAARSSIRQIAQLRGDLEERSGKIMGFQREGDRQTRLVERLESELQLSNERLARAKEELLDARWEALTLRGTVLRKANSVEVPASQVLDLENRVETATSERDQLRDMLVTVQSDLDKERITRQSKEEEFQAMDGHLKATIKDLRSAQKQMDRLRDNMSRKLILPFGRSQRKLQQLTARTWG